MDAACASRAKERYERAMQDVDLDPKPLLHVLACFAGIGGIEEGLRKVQFRAAAWSDRMFKSCPVVL